MLSMTPIEEAWGLNGKSIEQLSPYEKLKSTKTQMEKLVVKEQNTIQAYNDEYEYDGYVIRVDSFNPVRIDIAIQDAELVSLMKNLTYAEQQQKATELLLNYYKSNPTQSIQAGTVAISNGAYSSPNSARSNEAGTVAISNEAYSSPNSARSNGAYSSPNSARSNEAYSSPNSAIVPSSGVEYYRASTSENTHSNDSFLYFVLAIVLFILYEKLGGLSVQ